MYEGQRVRVVVTEKALQQVFREGELDNDKYNRIYIEELRDLSSKKAVFILRKGHENSRRGPWWDITENTLGIYEPFLQPEKPRPRPVIPETVVRAGVIYNV